MSGEAIEAEKREGNEVLESVGAAESLDMPGALSLAFGSNTEGVVLDALTSTEVATSADKLEVELIGTLPRTESGLLLSSVSMALYEALSVVELYW
jgi:hypothetical protein